SRDRAVVMAPVRLPAPAQARLLRHRAGRLGRPDRGCAGSGGRRPLLLQARGRGCGPTDGAAPGHSGRGSWRRAQLIARRAMRVERRLPVARTGEVNVVADAQAGGLVERTGGDADPGGIALPEQARAAAPAEATAGASQVVPAQGLG